MRATCGPAPRRGPYGRDVGEAFSPTVAFRCRCRARGDDLECSRASASRRRSRRHGHLYLMRAGRNAHLLDGEALPVAPDPGGRECLEEHDLAVDGHSQPNRCAAARAHARVAHVSRERGEFLRAPITAALHHVAGLSQRHDELSVPSARGPMWDARRRSDERQERHDECEAHGQSDPSPLAARPGRNRFRRSRVERRDLPREDARVDSRPVSVTDARRIHLVATQRGLALAEHAIDEERIALAESAGARRAARDDHAPRAAPQRSLDAERVHPTGARHDHDARIREGRAAPCRCVGSERVSACSLAREDHHRLLRRARV